MAKTKEAVHKIQLHLLEGTTGLNHLFAASSLISRSDYEDVVIERSITNLCGYPLCSNPLPSNRSRKGRYRISLKEHKVYDLNETYMYCSSDCVVNSRAFALSLKEERCGELDSAKIYEIMRFFDGLSLESDGIGDLGFGGLRIEENVGGKGGDVSLEEWIGPSNAIEGYVPRNDRVSKLVYLNDTENGSISNQTNPNKGESVVINEMKFTSEIIIGDQLGFPKTSFSPSRSVSKTKLVEESEKKVTRNRLGPQIELNELTASEEKQLSNQGGCSTDALELKKNQRVETTTHLGEPVPKSSLKPSGAKKSTHSVTWADEEKVDNACFGNHCEVREMEEVRENGGLGRVDEENGDCSLRYASAEACAMALTQAAEAIASGEADTIDAVSVAGVTILPSQPDAKEGKFHGDFGELDPEPATLKWPLKPGMLQSDVLDTEDSLYDSPPEGFNLTLSTFATMWMALFSWITSSSIAYIYGRDDSFHEEYSFVNGREYPQKIVFSDGRSSEIKRTLSGCLARALPQLALDLRLSTPISIMEQGMGHLLETMTFMDAVPPLRMRQWQVIVLLFIDALSVCRIPALKPLMTSKRPLFHKFLEGAQVSSEEYEVMKDLIIPLGRQPQFPAQCGG